MLLKPKIGIDNLKFGVTKKEIYEILGMPDRKTVDEDDINQLLLEYNKPKLRLTIYQDEDNRLGFIRTINPNLEFNGHKIIHAQIDKAVDEIFGRIIDDWEIEEYDFFTTYSNEDYWVTLYVEYGIVLSIEIGVPITDDDEFDWPI